MAARPVIPERAALGATVLADGGATAVTAARRAEEMAGPEEMAAMVAAAASWRGTRRPAAMAAMPVIPERAALAAALLAVRAATAVTAATVGRLMAASRLVAMAVLEAD